MIRFNGAEHIYRPGMLLKELAEAYYIKKGITKVAFEEFVIIVNNTAITSPQAEERVLLDNDNVYFVPIINGG